MKKTLKITTTLILIMAMVLLLSGCGEIKKAENSVNGMFSALKEADVENVVACDYIGIISGKIRKNN